MRYTAEQQKAIKKLFQAMVESIGETPHFAEYISDLRSTGLCLAEANLDLIIVPFEDDQVAAQSDEDWLKSLHISPDLEVPHDTQ
jgi:hypothetical protein